MTVDTTPPSVEGTLYINADRLSAQEGFNQLVVEFTVSETLEEATPGSPNPRVTVGNKKLTCDDVMPEESDAGLTGSRKDFRCSVVIDETDRFADAILENHGLSPVLTW